METVNQQNMIMINQEQYYLLKILSDHLKQRKTEVSGNIDWHVLQQYSQSHQVNGIVFYQCQSFLPDDIKPVLEEKFSSELFYYFNRSELFKKVKQAISDEGIEFYTVKGLDVAQFYPLPALRTMGDCDIVVHTDDKASTHAVMTELGFINKLKQDKEWTYSKNGMEFEIHDHLLYDEIGNYQSSRDFTELAWTYAKASGEGTRFVLDWNFHFLFLVLHLKKHIIHTGAGFRQFMDLAVVMQNCDLDWTWLEHSLGELNLWRFTKICLSLLSRWFEITLPIETDVIDDAFYEEATAKIFGNGVFGFEDSSNLENPALNAITQRKGFRKLIRIKTLFSNAFPSYQNMRYVPHYRFIDERPWLLPAAWVYRFYRSVRYHMGKDGKRMISNAFISDERLDTYEKALEKWGL